MPAGDAELQALLVDEVDAAWALLESEGLALGPLEDCVRDGPGRGRWMLAERASFAAELVAAIERRGRAVRCG